MKRSLVIVTLAVLVVAGCTRRQAAEVTGDVAIAAGRLAVNTTAKAAVGATRLAWRGGSAAVRAVQDARNPEGEPFPPGTVLCSLGDGTFVAARQDEEGTLFCPRRE